MKASWQEDYFKALIRLRLLLPVNPKIGAPKMRSVPYRGETRTSRAAARKAWMLCADEVIGNQGTSGDGRHFSDLTRCLI
jgi:hypothetical protein